jgi:hypothetical protein
MANAPSAARCDDASPDPLIGADVPLRRTLKRLGVKWLLEISVLEWHGNGVT